LEKKMNFEDYKIVLYRQSDGSWVAQIPAILGCHALMPTRDGALDELRLVFEMIEEEHQERGEPMPQDRELVYAAG